MVVTIPRVERALGHKGVVRERPGGYFGLRREPRPIPSLAYPLRRLPIRPSLVPPYVRSTAGVLPLPPPPMYGTFSPV